MAATTVEIPYLSAHYSIAESVLTTLTQAPTVGLVNQLLESITSKARETDELKSDKLRLEVELENVVRSSEAKIKVLKGSVEKGRAELEKVGQRLKDSGNPLTAKTFCLAVLSDTLQKVHAPRWSLKSPC